MSGSKGLLWGFGSLLAFAGLLAADESSAADDFKIMPGVACTTGGRLAGSPLNPSWGDPSYNARAEYGTYGGIYHRDLSGSLNSILAFCPIVRDSVFNDTSGLLSFTAYFTDDNPEGHAYCTLYSVSLPSGSGVPSILASDFQSSGISFSSGKVAKNYTVTSSQSLTGYYYLSCDLGPSTGLLAYRWKETSGDGLDL